MVRNRLFTVINIFGISISLACCIILFFYGTRELSYDRHHGKDIYRLVSNMSLSDGESLKVATNSIPIAPVVIEEIPEVISGARATSSSLFGGRNVIRLEDQSWTIEDGFVADTSFFEILNFKIIQGNIDNPITHHNAIALEKTWAIKLFGSENPIGKIIEISSDFGDLEFEITAIYDYDHFDAHLNPSFVVSMANTQWNNFFNRDRNNWVGQNMLYTYLELVPGSDLKLIEEKLNEILMKNGGESMKEMGVTKELYLQPVTDIHTSSEEFMANVPNTTNSKFIQVLILIGIIILILACVNYINLSTAQGGKRALEVGVRKVMGVTSKGLIYQFLGESFLLVLISLLLSLVFAQLALPYFNQLIDNPLQFSPKYFPLLFSYLLAFLVVTGLIAGFYPAFYLSSFKPTEVIKGRGRDHKGASILRKGLVIFQFVISISMISAIIVISKQVDFIKDKDLGFDSNSKLVIPLTTQEAISQYSVLKNAFNRSAMVMEVTGTDGVPGSPILNDLLLYKKGQTMDDAIHIYNSTIDLEFIDLMDMEVLSGSNFRDYNKDTTRAKILITQTGINMLGISLEDAPGSMAYFDFDGNSFEFEIEGVVNDIHQFSLHRAVDPLMYTIGDGNRYQYMMLDADLENFQALVQFLENEWKEVIKETPFSYFVLNDHLMQQYEGDFNTFNLIKYFAFISIIISVLGLYAMSMFLAERRFNEIGVRKAFGAEIKNIIVMVSADLSKLIAIAYLISIPVSIYAMNMWLDTFAYKITQGIEIYIIAGLISLLIAWLTISYQAFRAARTNPVDVLREE
jgi:putative ABC transport system permease protein